MQQLPLIDVAIFSCCQGKWRFHVAILRIGKLRPIFMLPNESLEPINIYNWLKYTTLHKPIKPNNRLIGY